MTASAFGSALNGSPRTVIRAIAFDAFVLFDPRMLVARTREIAGDKGDALLTAASAKLFAYTWFYTSAGRYKPFDAVAADAFEFAAGSLGIALSSADLAHLIDGYVNLGIWPDVPAALEALRRRGVRLAMLSNLPDKTLRANLRAAAVDRHFEFVLSTDEARQFKPAPNAYRLGVQAFRLAKSQIGFAASAAWDAAGATWFGYPTVWVNRTEAMPEQAHLGPCIVAKDMDGVLRLADQLVVANGS
jgi:2-haloacid dehalogenase